MWMYMEGRQKVKWLVGISVGLLALIWFAGFGEYVTKPLTKLYAFDEENGRIAWKAELPMVALDNGEIYVGQPAVANGRLAISLAQESENQDKQWQLFTFDAQNGSLLWQSDLYYANDQNAGYQTSTLNAPIITQSRLFAVRWESATEAVISAYDTQNGRLLWQTAPQKLPYNILFSFVANDSHLLYLTRDSNTNRPVLMAHSAEDGTEIWQAQLDDKFIAALPDLETAFAYLTLNEQSVYLTLDGSLFAYSLASGALVQEIRLQPVSLPNRVASGQGQLLHSSSRALHLFEADSGTLIHQITPSCAETGDRASFRDATLAIPYLFVYCTDGILGWQGMIAYSQQDENKLWQTQLAEGLDGFSLQTPAVGETAVFTYANMEQPALYALDKSDGSVIWEFSPVLTRSPVTHQSMVYMPVKLPRWRHWFK